MVTYWLFILCVVLLFAATAGMTLLWTLLLYATAGVLWVVYLRQKPPLYRPAAVSSAPLIVALVWPLSAVYALLARMRALRSKERYLVTYGSEPSQCATFGKWQSAVMFATKKAIEKTSTPGSEARSFFDDVVIIDQGRLRPSPIGGLNHAQFVVQPTGAIRRVV